MSVTAREKFCSVVTTGPLLKADAIVVLCGEDAEPRVQVAAQLMRQGAADCVVLSGGRDDPPRWKGADAALKDILGYGVSPTRVRLDNGPTNTREQAVNMVQYAKGAKWGRLLLVASPYHIYRAYLTFVRALQEAGQTEAIQVVAVPASQTAWFKSPEGVDVTRIELLDSEMAKCEQYNEHVATFEEGLEYLAHWESR